MKSAIKMASIISIITFLSKFIGIFRDTLMAWSFGTSAVVDAYSMSSGIAGIVLGLVGSTIGTTALPLYSDLKINQDSLEAKRFLINLLNILLVIAGVVSLLGWVFAEPVVKLFAGGFSGERLSLTVQMTRVMLLSFAFQMVGGVFGTYLQSERKFIFTMLLGFPLNFLNIAGILAATYWHPVWLSWGVVAGAAFNALMYVWMARRLGLVWRPYFDLKDPALRMVVRMMVPVWMGQALGILNTTVDRSMASYLPEGSIAAMNYAAKLLGSASSLFIPPMMMLLAPLFAEHAAESEERLLTSFKRSLRYLLLLIMPLTIGVIAVAEPTVRVLYGYGSFNEQAITLTVLAMVFYAFNSFILAVLNQSVYRVFVSLQDTLTPLKISAVTLCLNIALNIALVEKMGIGGLALATTMAAFVWVLAAMWLLRRKMGSIGGKLLLKTVFWSLGASLLMLLPVLAVNGLFVQYVQRWQRIGILGLSVLLGGVTYAVIISFSRIAEVDEIKAMLLEQVDKAIKRKPR